jgi:hypothetical protein
LKNNLKNNLKKQIKILKKSRIYLYNNKKNYYDSSLGYLDSLGDTPGYGLIQYWDKGIKKFYLLLFFILKDFLRSFYNLNYKSIGKIKKNYKTIFISWSKFDDFKKDGSYTDRYFNTNSNYKKNCLWFLVHLDNKIPKKISSNIIIIYKTKVTFSFIKLFIFTIKLIKNIFIFNLKLHKQSFQTVMAYNIYDKFKFLFNANLNKIFLPYEGQPFQNLLLKKTKEFNKNIRTYGFIHNFPPPLPTNLIFRSGSPDKIIVSGKDQKNVFCKYLNWDQKNVILSKSSRFINRKKNMSNKIFLPGYVSANSFKNITDKLKYIFLNLRQLRNKNFTIINHPHKYHSPSHLELINQIRPILKINNNKFLTKNNIKISIFIGATGGIIEALETGHEVIHLVVDPVFEIYSKLMYSNINCETICENIYKYKIKKKNSLINFGTKNLTFKKYLSY